MIDRATMADFLRRRREVLPLAEGTTAGVERRRTPGLRREEVAALAGISADYYARLEQGRGANPSHAVLTAVARALRLDADETDYLFLLAGGAPRPRTAEIEIGPGLLRTFRQLEHTPSVVVDDLGTVVVKTPLARALFGSLLPDRTDPGLHPGNTIWAWFADPTRSRLFPEEDWPAHSQGYVAGLRAVHARRGQDPDVVALVEDLLAVSDEFADVWTRHEVADRHVERMRVDHTELGLIEVDSEILLSHDHSATLLTCFPAPGTDAAEKLAALSAEVARTAR